MTRELGMVCPWIDGNASTNEETGDWESTLPMGEETVQVVLTSALRMVDVTRHV